MLRGSLAVLWIGSGLIGLLQPTTVTAAALRILDLGSRGNALLVWASCLLDIALGIALLTRWRPAITAVAQLLLVGIYTAFLTVAHPSLWGDPFGPLLKNIPIMVAILVLAAIETDR